MIRIQKHIGLRAALTYLVALAVYGWDKWTEKRGARRVPKSTLHSLALAGGRLGAWLGQQVFRHKTRQFKFQRVC